MLRVFLDCSQVEKKFDEAVIGILLDCSKLEKSFDEAMIRKEMNVVALAF